MKVTQADKVAKLMQANPAIKPKEIAKKLGMTVQQVYVLRNQVKKKLGKVTAKTTPKVTREVAETTITLAYVKKLEDENVEYHNWCLQWREKHDKLEQALAITESELADARAVVRYLEGRVL